MSFFLHSDIVFNMSYIAKKIYGEIQSYACQKLHVETIYRKEYV